MRSRAARWTRRSSEISFPAVLVTRIRPLSLAKITTVVMAEGSWSMEVPNEQMLYGRTFGTEMGTVRWDLIAQGLGCEGLYATTLDEDESSLATARAARGPAVVCVRTDRAANMGVPPEAALRFMEVYQGQM